MTATRALRALVGPRGTFRRRLIAIVGLTALGLVAMMPADLVTSAAVERHLGSIESDYIPLLDLGPAMANGFTDLAHSLEEAVAAQDSQALAATQDKEKHLLALLDTAPAIVSPGAITQLRDDIESWYSAAVDVSRRLITGEKGEAIVSAMESMQALQRNAQARLRSTVMLDRGRLQTAFTQARRTHRLSVRVRTVVQLVLAFAVTALALTMARKVVSGIGVLSAGFERFGRGEFEPPIPAIGDDELSQVARKANRMASRLRELDQQVQARQEELERANRELEAFSYSVSHDLRAPLRGIDGFSLALLEDYSNLLPEQGRDYLGRVRAAAQRMAALIDDILRLSRITRSELKRTRVDISAMAERIAVDLASAEPQRSVEVSIQPGLMLDGDAELLRIALENLLGNAWKFASRVDKPHIEVGVTKVGALFVRDNGVGFEPEQASRLFVPFQRLHSTEEFPGTGIGLATVQRIVHRHGGRVWAEGAVGQGASFYLSIPPQGGAHAQGKHPARGGQPG